MASSFSAVFELYAHFGDMNSRAFLTRIPDLDRNPNMIHVVFYLKIELMPSNFTMHYISVIEIFLRNCIQTIIG